MKTSVMGAAVLVLGVGPAFAADLPSAKQAPPLYGSPAPSWTGFYMGLNAGFDWGTSDSAATVATPLFDAIAVTTNTLDPAHVVAGGLVNGSTALATTGVARLSQNGLRQVVSARGATPAQYRRRARGHGGAPRNARLGRRAARRRGRRLRRPPLFLSRGNPSRRRPDLHKLPTPEANGERTCVEFKC